MGMYLGNAAHAALIGDPRGLYIGKGRMHIESSAATAVIAVPSLALPETVKVPAGEFARLVEAGITDFELRGTQLLCRGTNFSALLPCALAPSHAGDIKINAHEPLALDVACKLIALISLARHYASPASIHPAFRFVYAAERRVFATDGNQLFVGRLPGLLPKRLIFTTGGCNDLARYWRCQIATRAMCASRSLLLKNGTLATEIRCVDTAVPTPLYRAVRSAALEQRWVHLDTAELKRAVQCLELAGGGRSATVLVELAPRRCLLRGTMGEHAIPTIDWEGAAVISLRAQLSHLVCAVESLTADRVLLGTLSHVTGNLTFSIADGDYFIAVRATAPHATTSVGPRMIDVGRSNNHPVMPEPFANCLSAAELQEAAYQALRRQLKAVLDGKPDAQAWLHAANDGAAYSLDQLCAVLNLDPAQLRSGVDARLRGRAQEETQRRAAA
jgi:hypothetical protein